MNVKKRRIKVFLLQEVIPNYRVPIFERLASLPNIDLLVIASKDNQLSEVSDVKSSFFKQERLRLIPSLRRKFFIGISCYILKHKPDVIIGGGGIIDGLYISPISFFLIKALNIKIIRWTCDGYNAQSNSKKASLSKRLRSFISLKLMKACDGYITYSDLTKRYYMAQGIKESRIFVAYNSLDTDVLFSAAEECENAVPILAYNPHRIISIGRLIKSKKIDILIKAFQIVQNHFNNAELIIIGDGPEREHLENIVQQLSIKSVKFFGRIYDNKTKGRYLLASSLFVLPSLGGLAILEAMAFGLPVIASKADGTEKDLIENGVNGFLVSGNNLSVLAEKIMLLLKDDKLRIKMGIRARETIRNKINIHKMIGGFERAIHFAFYGQTQGTLS